jgi:hypothetical protein
VSKLKIITLLLGLNFVILNNLQSQVDFYNYDEVREIRIEFYDDNWKSILDSLFSAEDNFSRIKADVIIDGNRYKECGIRYKGFSSWNVNEVKNPFNINLDYTYKNQNHQGYKKLKLSNVIYDPSFVREVVSYDIARKYMPVSGANFANLYINDTLIGLYSNVEAVDDCFVEKHFGGSKNPFFKGNPEKLIYPYGQNANLAHSHGSDSSGYMPYYSIESEYGWEELYNLIYVLNLDTANLSDVLNIDRALWMHALNYSLLNLDSYIAYAQNYYLYQENNGVFSTIPWDLNMSFGSFRHSDGSTNFSGLTIAKLETLNPLQHLTFSISPRPLMKNLFLNSTYKKMYLAHIRTIIDENIANNYYLDLATHLHSVIDTYVVNDTNKFYSYEDFVANIDTTTGSSSEQYPGLKSLMEARYNYLDAYYGMRGNPEFVENSTSREIAVRGEKISFYTKLNSPANVRMYYRFNSEEQFMYIIMTDDGDSDDLTEGDSVYSASIVPQGKLLQYYFWAENDSAGTFLPCRAAYDFFNIPVRPEQGEIKINEISLNNILYENTILPTDIAWIELYNNTNESLDIVSLKLCYKGLNIDVPDTVINEYGYFLFSREEFYFTDFENLYPFSDDYIYLSYKTEKILDSNRIYSCSNDRTIGLFPDGSDVCKVLFPTPSMTNFVFENEISPISLYPNPVSDALFCNINVKFAIENVLIYNSLGQLVYCKQCDGLSSCSFILNTLEWSDGVYYLKFVGEQNYCSSKFIKQ